MSPPIEFHNADRVSTGALGVPGSRRFMIQAEQDGAQVTVLVEKEQVAMLSARVVQLLDEVEKYYTDDESASADATPVEAAEPLFRARMMRLGFDLGRDLVVLELFEAATEEDDIEELDFDDEPPDEMGRVARIFASRSQMKALAVQGAEVVAAGRPVCDLCRLPKDPEGHDCPSKN